jgi:hypothetical protein
VLCSGKVYFDLVAERRKRKIDNVAILRIEQLYPFPFTRLAKCGLRSIRMPRSCGARRSPRTWAPGTSSDRRIERALRPSTSRPSGRLCRPRRSRVACDRPARTHLKEQADLVDRAAHCLLSAGHEEEERKSWPSRSRFRLWVSRHRGDRRQVAGKGRRRGRRRPAPVRARDRQGHGRGQCQRRRHHCRSRRRRRRVGPGGRRALSHRRGGRRRGRAEACCPGRAAQAASPRTEPPRRRPPAAAAPVGRARRLGAGRAQARRREGRDRRRHPADRQGRPRDQGRRAGGDLVDLRRAGTRRQACRAGRAAAEAPTARSG